MVVKGSFTVCHLSIVRLSYCSPGDDSSSLTEFNCCYVVQDCLIDCECTDNNDNDFQSTNGPVLVNFRRRRSSTCDHDDDVAVQCSKSTSKGHWVKSIPGYYNKTGQSPPGL